MSEMANSYKINIKEGLIDPKTNLPLMKNYIDMAINW